MSLVAETDSQLIETSPVEPQKKDIKVDDVLKLAALGKERGDEASSRVPRDSIPTSRAAQTGQNLMWGAPESSEAQRRYHTNQ